MGRPARDAVRQMAADYPDAWREYCWRIAQLEGWNCQHCPDACLKYMARILNSGHRAGHAPRNFDLDWALVALEFFPVDRLTPLFQRVAAVAEVRREAQAEEKPAMRKVERLRAREVG